MRFICGPAVPFKMELPSQVPDSLQLIGATLTSGTHYAVLCCQSFITKGTRYGPYRGTIVKPSDVTDREDAAFMWEVMSKCPVRVFSRQMDLVPNRFHRLWSLFWMFDRYGVKYILLQNKCSPSGVKISERIIQFSVRQTWQPVFKPSEGKSL